MRKLKAPMDATGAGGITRRRLLIAGTATAIAVACAPAATTSSPTPAGTTGSPGQAASPQAATGKPLKDEIKIGWIEAVSLDPATMALIYDFTVGKQLYNGLVRYKIGTVQFEPDLAERWDISSDGSVYTFYLRKGVKWHRDFGEVTAQDVKYSIERLQDPKTKARFAVKVQDVDRVEVVDSHTARIRLKRPNATFLSSVVAYFQGFLVTQKAVEKYGQDYFLNPVGTGPYRFVEWKKGSHILLESNPDHWEGAPKTKFLRFVPIPQPATRRLALENGEIDVYWNADEPTLRQALGSNPKFEVKITDAPHVGYIILNPRVKPLGDIRVRRALAHAIDYDAVVNGVLKGYAKKGVSLVPPGMFGHTTEGVARYDYDPKKAKDLLAEAGVGQGFSLPATILQQTFQPDIYQVVQSNWRDVGVDLQIKLVDAPTWVKALSSADTVVYGGTTLQPRPEDILVNFTSSACRGLGAIACYKTIDDAFARYETTTDVKKQEQILGEIQRQMLVDLPAIPLYHFRFADIISSRMKNYIRGMLLVDMDLRNTTVEKP